MFLRKTALILIVLTIGLTGCALAAPSSPASLTPVSLPLGYIPNVQFAPLYVAMEKGYFKDAGIDLTLDYSFETDAMALVGANKLQFAMVSGEQVLLARAQALPVVYISAWYQDFPVGIVSLTSAGITSPADLKGKSIGVPVLSGASYIGLRALLSAGGLEEKDVNIQVVGFNQVEALVSGQVDAAVVYVANEPVQLKARGYDIQVLRVADYMELVSNGLVTNETTLAANPALAAALAAAIQKGIVYTAAHPEEAYEISKQYVENLAQADAATQQAVLAESIGMWQIEKPGYTSPASWQNMADVLTGMGMLPNASGLEQAYTNQFSQ
jgi:NitT/TauT family transport system substrate-binding protein